MNQIEDVVLSDMIYTTPLTHTYTHKEHWPYCRLFLSPIPCVPRMAFPPEETLGVHTA